MDHKEAARSEEAKIMEKEFPEFIRARTEGEQWLITIDGADCELQTEWYCRPCKAQISGLWAAKAHKNSKGHSGKTPDKASSSHWKPPDDDENINHKSRSTGRSRGHSRDKDKDRDKKKDKVENRNEDSRDKRKDRERERSRYNKRSQDRSRRENHRSDKDKNFRSRSRTGRQPALGKQRPRSPLKPPRKASSTSNRLELVKAGPPIGAAPIVTGRSEFVAGGDLSEQMVEATSSLGHVIRKEMGQHIAQTIRAVVREEIATAMRDIANNSLPGIGAGVDITYTNPQWNDSANNTWDRGICGPVQPFPPQPPSTSQNYMGRNSWQPGKGNRR